MGILRDKVISAFKMYKAGDFKGFVFAIADVSDVRYQFHYDIVIDEINKQLKML